MSNQYSVKVYFIENETTKEIRKFSVEEDLIGTFEYLVGKIRQVFPDLLRIDFHLYWKDDENDYITISSNDELLQAINTNVNTSGCFKFYVKAKLTETSHTTDNNNTATAEEHVGVTCDGCNQSIKGIRFKCVECYDFDLCSTCIKKNDHPKDHEMLRITKPRRSGNIFVAKMPPFFCQRRTGAFRPSCNRRQSPYAKHFSHCPFTDSPMTEDGASKENVKKEEPMISELASAFGLDPDVAVSTMKVFLENMTECLKKSETDKKENKDEKKETAPKKDEPTSEPKTLEDSFADMSQQFGLNPNFVSDALKNVLGNINKVNQTEVSESKNDDSMDFNIAETSADKTETKIYPDIQTTIPKSTASHTEANSMTSFDDVSPNVSSANNLNDPKIQSDMLQNLTAEFGKNFNMNPQENNFANLGELVKNMFQPQPTNTTDKQASKDDFIMVDDANLTAEESYNKRLDKALKQMEAMGFDNEGGWLKQLLISKELSVGKVLDALNPSN